MMLRALLLCLVTCLGLELPTRADVAAMVESGRQWCTIRAEEWDARMPNDVGALSAEPAPKVDDSSFAALVDETAATFAADLAPAPADRSFAALVDDTAIAFAADLALNATPEPASSAVTVEEEPGSRELRLAEAVRLTGRAVHAWVDLLHGPTVAALDP